MTDQRWTTRIETAEQMAAFARHVMADLRAGFPILLSGDIGAGKTTFARAALQSVMREPEDVPSPTFTIVQVYDTTLGEVWHSDLYRLESVDDVAELGLIDAMETDLCLIEWPEILPPECTRTALSLRLSIRNGDARDVSATWRHPYWGQKLAALAA